MVDYKSKKTAKTHYQTVGTLLPKISKVRGPVALFVFEGAIVSPGLR